ncbi:MAG: hypothetical protein RDU89_04410 [bacterium]|nr:hypothetical protein [bacterium]
MARSLAEGDAQRCLQACLSVLEWGGVRRWNDHYLQTMGSRLGPQLLAVKRKLRLESLDTSALPPIRMSSGMVKIYSLLVDDLVMYDSRVAAALCLLTRLFCREAGIHSVPRALRFGLLPHRSQAQRDPSEGSYSFPTVVRSEAYLDSLARASWLLRAVVRGRRSLFTCLGTGEDLHALQSALFMLGYDVGGQRLGLTRST